MIEFEITAGRLTALSRLLVFLKDNQNVDAGVACQYLVRTRSIQNEAIAKNALHWAMSLNLIVMRNGLIELSSSGESIVLGSQEQDGLALQRRLLIKALVKTRRDLLWIAFAEPQELKEQVPMLFQILTELRLVERKRSDEATAFWQDLKQAEIKFNDAISKKIGDEAEALSMKYESDRLTNLGFSDLAAQITWLSRESDLHGYDILSFMGDSINPRERRHIEVKRAKVVNEFGLQFYLSRNEFSQAKIIGPKYLFHLWWSKPHSSEIHLSVVQSSKVLELVPSDKDSHNFWTECVVTYNLDSSTTST